MGQMETQTDIDLISPAFESGQYIHDRYTSTGRNISPPLNWSPLTEGTRELALIMDDPDAPNGVFTHWILYHLPLDSTSLPEDYVPDQEVLVGRNDFGNAGYGGPCPPIGETHHFYFRLYALDSDLGLSPGLTRAQLIERMHGHILSETELIGLYGR